ncbi:MAG: glycosyltransferase family 2 protein [Saprospiraceae bacterium]|nr:glycosyltransferase family 2 protein [Saprospiraceae bacterium]
MTLSGVELVFWALIFVVFYAYLGYGILLWVLVKTKRLFFKNQPNGTVDSQLPGVVFIVAAYNEEDYILEKIKNCLAFDYPKEKIEFWFVTDGSNDSTPKLVVDYPTLPGQTIRLFHSPARKGKIAAVERVMAFVKAPITIFTDANTDVNPMAIRNIVRHYADPKVGAVAGEKRIALSEKDDASGAGEGIYWKYESLLKKWDSELYSAIGAAGELFSIRTEQYRHVEQDTLIEDFVMTMGIAMRGYKIVYEPDAYAVESSSASIGEELKRKIRIAAGALQAVWRLRSLLNPFKYGLLSFQYLSHRVLRWTLAPLALPIIFLLNIGLAMGSSILYKALLAGQILFYAFAILGYIFERKQLKIKAFFVPYYFCVMNYAMYRGFFRLVGGRQSVVWEKAKRAV